MPIFNGIIKGDNNSLVRKPTTAFAGIVGFPLTYAVLPYAQPNNIVGWFNNGDGITTATGVSAWVDRISGVSLAQGTGALQPTYTQQNQSLNNKAKAVFSSTQYLSAGDVYDLRTDGGLSLCYYGKILTSNTNRTLCGKVGLGTGAVSIAGEYKFQMSLTTIAGQFFDTSSKTTATAVFDPNNYYLYTLVIDRTNSLLSFYINEGLIGTVAISNAGTDYNNGSPFIIGTSNSLQTMEMLEVLNYNVALSQSDVAQNSISIRGKYGQK
ncbi:hypothetical protein UFOVP518_18 [uncultured Caudovirales phage]|uniref:Concanavalin A-like lectin/glucanases superfamily n=1 Tax=uncultured Caudovirales phage TaxID=2100421 RepID=A0A6J5MJ67_9CAUD|nr:hypothetical protein UFOVP518_18 [uncultured Caudovirales phage]